MTLLYGIIVLNTVHSELLVMCIFIYCVKIDLILGDTKALPTVAVTLKVVSSQMSLCKC